MARTTRSSATVQEKDKSSDKNQEIPPTTKLKNKNKKRKRDSAVEHEDQPVNKLPRQDRDDELSSVDVPPTPDTLLDPTNAQQILDILEMVDTQGLLDRVFPLSSDPSSAKSCSFRTLLQEPSEHSLRVLRTAIQHLFPISSHSRSRSSTPGAQQLRFCNLTLTLLDQVSQCIAPISLDTESLLTLVENETSTLPVKRRKFALMQKLPSGEWWTSLDSNVSAQGKELKELGTGHAELVSILPTPSTSTLPSDLPTLGSYTTKKSSGSKRLGLSKHRWVSRGSFLDYGAFASFAPSFEQEGREVGRFGLGEVLLAEKRYAQRARAAEKLRRKRLKNIRGRDVTMEETDKESPLDMDDWEDSLKALLDHDEVDSLKSAMDTLDLESSAQELLNRNSQALVRLEELQEERFGRKGKFRGVEVGSEEWDTAKAIMESFAILASLRPRTSNNESIVPPPSLLRRLHQTLPLDSSPGWYGTLPSTRTTALRDDTTVHLKSGAFAAAIDPSLAKRGTPAKPVVGQPYPGYPPSNYQTTVPYAATPGYPNYPPAAQGSYYQSYGNNTTSAYPNQQYPTSGWYGSYGQTQTPGRATPIVATTIPPAGGHYSQQQRAVANTVNSKGHQGYAPVAGGAAPYLPAHMRAGGSASQPGTPGAYHQTLR